MKKKQQPPTAPFHAVAEKHAAAAGRSTAALACEMSLCKRIIGDFSFLPKRIASKKSFAKSKHAAATNNHMSHQK